MRKLVAGVLAACVAVVLANGCRSTTGPTAALTLTGISPPRAQIGDAITLTGTGFAQTGNAVQIGAGYVLGLGSTDGKTLRFALPAYLNSCPPTEQICAMVAMAVTPGTYQLSVVTDHGSSNALPFTNIQTGTVP